MTTTTAASDGPLPVLQTARLRLRPLTLQDDGFIVALLNDAGWLRFIGDRNVRSLADAQAYLTTGPLAMYARAGLGLLAVEQLAGGPPIGMVGLIRRPSLDDVDLGFALLPPHGGHGFAAEAAAAVLDDGRTRLGLSRIVAIVQPDNERSIALLSRLGFAFERLLPPTADAPALQLHAWAAPTA